LRGAEFSEVQGAEGGQGLLRGDVKSYAQQMEYQDDQPSEHPADRADEYGEQIDGYVVRKNEVRQEEKD
jgi:hypothetical protein